jgi:hypothetical protein
MHRPTATLAFWIRLSPFYEDQLVPVLSVLHGVGSTLKGKLVEDGKLKEGDQWGNWRIDCVVSDLV